MTISDVDTHNMDPVDLPHPGTPGIEHQAHSHDISGKRNQ